MNPPVAPSSSFAASAKAGQGGDAPTPVNILIVDDEPRNLDVLESILYGPEYRLVRAGSADEALLALIHTEFAVLVLDINMPGTNGIELASLIKQRKRTQHVPILFLTAYYQDEKYVLEGYSAGAVDYLTKPVNPDILRSKVAVFVDLHRMNEALALANRSLESEIRQRERAEESLREANAGLEERVRERTEDLRRSNEDLAHARDEALAASRAKDDFLAALSHELRTPLSPVLLLASEAASNMAFPEEVREAFSVIRKNITLEARLIDDLLDLTRINHGKLSFEVQPCDVHAVLQDTLGIMRDEFQAKGVHLAAELKAGRQTILADAIRLQQAFWNILKNGVKFTPQGGSMTIETSDHEGRLVIRMRDTGIGMNPDELGLIFDPFVQGERHARHPKDGSRLFGGLGLGLAITRALIENQGGSIRAESEGANRGSCFIVEFSLSETPSTNEAPPPSGNGGSNGVPKAEKAEASRTRRRILLVEDHEPTRHALTYLLERRRFEVTSTASIAEARERAGGTPFDLLISDIGLPDGDGHRLMEELRGRAGELKGIALSGYGMEHDIQRSKEAGFILHLTKPVDVQALDSALAQVFESQD